MHHCLALAVCILKFNVPKVILISVTILRIKKKMQKTDGIMITVAIKNSSRQAATCVLKFSIFRLSDDSDVGAPYAAEIWSIIVVYLINLFACVNIDNFTCLWIPDCVKQSNDDGRPAHHDQLRNTYSFPGFSTKRWCVCAWDIRPSCNKKILFSIVTDLYIVSTQCPALKQYVACFLQVPWWDVLLVVVWAVHARHE